VLFRSLNKIFFFERGKFMFLHKIKNTIGFFRITLRGPLLISAIYT